MSSDPPTPLSSDDPRRDPMAPPDEPCECWCLHCRRTFMSDQIWFQRVINDPDGFPGFWMCPTPNCGGAGFTFDIFPTDPNHPANEGWSTDDDEEQEDYEEVFEVVNDPDAEWDPEESEYQGGEDDEDMEGEEWKYGLQPGERPEADPRWDEARRAWEEEQRKYDEPDQRPRELDWSDRPSRRLPADQEFREDDIPF
jgi:hypothetical protein